MGAVLAFRRKRLHYLLVKAMSPNHLRCFLLFPSEVYSPWHASELQGQTKHTRTAEGAFPLWNEQMAMSFRPPNNDFSPQSLMCAPDLINISVFDEVAVLGGEDGGAARGRRSGEEGDEGGARTLRNYMGKLTIPISSVYRSQVIRVQRRLTAGLFSRLRLLNVPTELTAGDTAALAHHRPARHSKKSMFHRLHHQPILTTLAGMKVH